MISGKRCANACSTWWGALEAEGKGGSRTSATRWGKRLTNAREHSSARIVGQVLVNPCVRPTRRATRPWAAPQDAGGWAGVPSFTTAGYPANEPCMTSLDRPCRRALGALWGGRAEMNLTGEGIHARVTIRAIYSDRTSRPLISREPFPAHG